ncbi:hypothetical protein ACFV4P_34330 [Kitasatospora sp. NPDC059795]|uniref:hypothetical protein n=1 Tax=Kitasatospora sp. NPDC059795 TaxID=3346949 RepID=UPI003646CFF8
MSETAHDVLLALLRENRERLAEPPGGHESADLEWDAHMAHIASRAESEIEAEAAHGTGGPRKRPGSVSVPGAIAGTAVAVLAIGIALAAITRSVGILIVSLVAGAATAVLSVRRRNEISREDDRISLPPGVVLRR